MNHIGEEQLVLFYYGESGEGAVKAHALAGERNDASIISAAEFIPPPDELQPPTTRIRVCGHVFR